MNEDWSSLGRKYRDGYGVELDPLKAIEFFKKAEAWDAIGYMYLEGDGLERDLQKAREYFQRAFENNDTTTRYLYDYATEKLNKGDNVTGVAALEIASEFGYKPAALKLAEMYCYGIGVECNGQKAVEFFTKAEAWSAIGEMYRDSNGVEPDAQRAIEFFAKAKEWDLW